MDFDAENIKKFKKDLEDSLKEFKPIIDNMQSMNLQITPQLIKDTVIEGEKCKLTLHKNNMITITFENNNFGKLIYEKW